jgi:hypothetical protein
VGGLVLTFASSGCVVFVSANGRYVVSYRV